MNEFGGHICSGVSDAMGNRLVIGSKNRGCAVGVRKIDFAAGAHGAVGGARCE